MEHCTKYILCAKYHIGLFVKNVGHGMPVEVGGVGDFDAALRTVIIGRLVYIRAALFLSYPTTCGSATHIFSHGKSSLGVAVSP